MTVSLHQPRMAAAQRGNPAGSNTRQAVRVRRRLPGGGRGRPKACEGVLAARRPRPGLWLTAKVVTAVALMVVGFGVSVAEMASWVHLDPAVEYVKGDPAWAHVDRSLPRN